MDVILVNKRKHRGSASTQVIVACLLFALLTGVYWLTYSGTFYAFDEYITFSSTASLVKHGDTTVNQVAYLRDLLGWSPYSKYDPAQAFLAAPLYWLAMQASHLNNVQVVMTLNLWMVAATGCLVFLYTQRLGYELNTSVLVALLFGLASGAWPSTKSFFSEPMSMFSLSLAAYGLLLFKQSSRWEYVGLCSLSLGLALATRTQNIVALPAFGLYGLALIVTHTDPTARKPTNLARYVLVAAAPLTLWATGALFYNWIRYGDPLSTGYGISLREVTNALGFPLGRGLLEHLVGPAHGLLIYSPIFLASVVGLLLLWRRHRLESALVAMLSASYLLFHALYGGSGGWVWGHRYLLPLCPMLTISLAPLVESLRRGRHTLGWILFGLLVLISGAVQLLAVTVDYGCCLVQEMPATTTLGTYTDPRFSWLAVALSSLSPTVHKFAWLGQKASSEAPYVSYLPLLVTIAWIVAAIVGLRRFLRVTEELKNTPAAVYLLNATLLVTVGSSVLLFAYGWIDTPQEEAIQALLGRVAAQARPNDSLIVVSPRAMHTDLFLGMYDGPQRYIGLDFETPPLRPQIEALLDEVSTTHSHVWLAVRGRWPTATDNGVEEWLDRYAFPVRRDWVTDFGYLAHYARPAEALFPLPLRPAAIFSDVAELLGAATAPGQLRPGEVVYVTLQWKALVPSPVSYTVFTQLISADGQWVAGSDRVPVHGRWPTNSWKPDQLIIDHHGILVPAHVPDGYYEVWVGLYDVETGERLSVADSDLVSIEGVIVARQSDYDALELGLEQ